MARSLNSQLAEEKEPAQKAKEVLAKFGVGERALQEKGLDFKQVLDTERDVGEMERPVAQLRSDNLDDLTRQMQSRDQKDVKQAADKLVAAFVRDSDYRNHGKQKALDELFGDTERVKRAFGLESTDAARALQSSYESHKKVRDLAFRNWREVEKLRLASDTSEKLRQAADRHVENGLAKDSLARALHNHSRFQGVTKARALQNSKEWGELVAKKDWDRLSQRLIAFEMTFNRDMAAKSELGSTLLTTSRGYAESDPANPNRNSLAVAGILGRRLRKASRSFNEDDYPTPPGLDKSTAQGLDSLLAQEYTRQNAEALQSWQRWVSGQVTEADVKWMDGMSDEERTATWSRVAARFQRALASGDREGVVAYGNMMSRLLKTAPDGALVLQFNRAVSGVGGKDLKQGELARFAVPSSGVTEQERLYYLARLSALVRSQQDNVAAVSGVTKSFSLALGNPVPVGLERTFVLQGGEWQTAQEKLAKLVGPGASLSGLTSRPPVPDVLTALQAGLVRQQTMASMTMF